MYKNVRTSMLVRALPPSKLFLRPGQKGCSSTGRPPSPTPSIENPVSSDHCLCRCADSFEVWVWKEGQEKSQGKKSILTGHQTLKMEVSLEPCVFYNIA